MTRRGLFIILLEKKSGYTESRLSKLIVYYSTCACSTAGGEHDQYNLPNDSIFPPAHLCANEVWVAAQNIMRNMLKVLDIIGQQKFEQQKLN